MTIPHPSEDEIKDWMMGNLCRCTGYYKILDSIKAAAGEPAMIDFDYQAPTRLDEALDLLKRARRRCPRHRRRHRARHHDEAAAGTAARCWSRCVALPSLEQVRSDNGSLHLGATATHRVVETSPSSASVGRSSPRPYRHVATVRIRNMATVGGGVVHGDPNMDPPPALIALDAKARLRSASGEREIALQGFFLDYYETDLQPGEILTEVVVPEQPRDAGWSWVKFLPRTADDYATVSVACLVSLENGSNRCREARIALGSAATTPVRADAAEAALRGQELTPERLREAAQLYWPARWTPSPTSAAHRITSVTWRSCGRDARWNRPCNERRGRTSPLTAATIRRTKPAGAGATTRASLCWSETMAWEMPGLAGQAARGRLPFAPDPAQLVPRLHAAQHGRPRRAFLPAGRRGRKPHGLRQQLDSDTPGRARLDAVKEFNAFAAEVTAKHPQRLVGLASTVPFEGDAFLQELERALTRDGLKGVMINTSTDGEYLDSRRADPFWDLVTASRRARVHPSAARDDRPREDGHVPPARNDPAGRSTRRSRSLA